jgi:hypothetical protein
VYVRSRRNGLYLPGNSPGGLYAAPVNVGLPTNARASVGSDGPANVYVPLLAADWAQLALPAPGYQWNCQDASGDLVAATGSINLVKSGTGPQVYQQSITGWTRKFVGLNSEASSKGWFTTDTSFTPALSQSFAMLAYVATSASISDEYFLVMGGSGNGMKTTSGAGPTFAYSHYLAGSADTSVYTLNNSPTTVRPVMFGRNCATSTKALFTDGFTLGGTFSAAKLASDTKGIFTHSGNGVYARYGLIAVWMGADAEAVLKKSTLTALGWSLSY